MLYLRMQRASILRTSSLEFLRHTSKAIIQHRISNVIANLDQSYSCGPLERSASETKEAIIRTVPSLAVMTEKSALLCDWLYHLLLENTSNLTAALAGELLEYH